MTHPYNPPFKSEIFYSVQNEDYQTELELLKRLDRGQPLRVLLVASSGENALSLLTQASVGKVDAVDINPAQLHLVELRRTAAQHLSQDEQLRLLGADASRLREEGEADRLELFERNREHLPEASRTFWEARRYREIAFGIQHVGCNEVCMHDLTSSLQMAGFEPLAQPLKDEELPKWQAVYAALMTTDYVRELFGLQSEVLAVKIAGIATYLAECHFRALQKPEAEYNPFLTTVFANRYATAAGETVLPLYLQEVGQLALQQLGTEGRLSLYQANILLKMVELATSEGRYDLVSISNIADWLSEEEFSSAVAKVKQYLNPGGFLLARTTNPRQPIAEIMGRYLEVEADLNAQLSAIERGPWFRIIATGRCA